MDRRSFVKGSALVGAGAAAGAAGAAAFGLARPREADRTLRYLGAAVVGGPAPRGLPLLPLRADDDGVLHGAPFAVGEDVLAWHRFCGRDSPLLHGEGDETLRFAPWERESDAAPWWAARAGEPLRVADFDAGGKGARATWRHPPDVPAHATTAQVIVLRLRADAVGRYAAPPGSDAPHFLPRLAPTAEEWRLVRERFLLPLGDGSVLLAASAVCTHFCCLAGWKEAERIAATRDAVETIFCACHLAAFDPTKISAFEVPVPY